MRSMILAFACISAVACGTVLTSLDHAWLLGLLGALVVIAAVLALRRERMQTTGVLLICLGLLRGASVGPHVDADPQLGERGGAALLRTFSIVGASEPGPSCRVELDGGLRVSAPIESCPLASGDEVAILSASLRPDWRAAVHEGPPIIELGSGAVLWRRPVRERGRVQGWIDHYWQWVAHRRQRAWVESRGDGAASLVMAAGLGLRAALDPEQREHLRAAGLGHLIAVSGLHIAIAAVWLQFLARRLAPSNPARACVIAWLPLWGYVGLTGAAASAVRAAVMLTLVDLGTIVGRPIHPPTTLAVTAAGMLLWQPQWLSDPGFGLSLAAMAAIVTAPREQGMLATSWRITWATAPLSVWLFDAAPLHGLFANLVALPLFGLMMPPALLACVGAGPLAELALVVARWFAAPILDLAAWLAAVPSAGPLGLLAIAGLGLGLHGLRLPERVRSWLPPRLACVLALVVSAWLCLDGARTRDSAGPPRFDWIAMGSIHSRALLVADRSQPGHACLYRPTGSSATWRWLLGELGVTHIDRLDAALPDGSAQPRQDPRTRELAVALARAGFELGDGAGLRALAPPLTRDPHARAAGCEPPPVEQVRRALRACRFLQPRGPVLARSWAGIHSCRIEDRWVHVERE